MTLDDIDKLITLRREYEEATTEAAKMVDVRSVNLYFNGHGVMDLKDDRVAHVRRVLVELSELRVRNAVHALRLAGVEVGYPKAPT